MSIEMGPILRLQDKSEDKWQLTVLIVTSEPKTELRYWEVSENHQHQVKPEILITHDKNCHALRFSMNIALSHSNEKRIEYSIDSSSTTWSFVIPSLEGSQLRAAFVSCNGFSSNKERRHSDNPYERWEDIVEQHKTSQEGAFHLLIMGGDQVYADPIWDQKPQVKEWAQKQGDEKWLRSTYSNLMKEEVEDFYFNLYVNSWGKQSSVMQEALASIPTIMMWDDHDIFDGWGSYEDEKLDSDVYRGIYDSARTHFQVFQLQMKSNERWNNHLCTDNMTYGITLDDIGILALDLRSERRQDKVLSRKSWDEIYTWLDQLGNQLNHLLVVSSVPVVHIDLSAFEWVTGVVNVGNYDDDLRDHWLSRAHKQERLRLIQRMFEFSYNRQTRVTFLSGDIHVAALGVLEQKQDEDTETRGGSIYQIISSPVVHTTPPTVMRWFYDQAAQNVEEVDRRITSRFVKMPASQDYYIGERNWVAMEIERSSKRRLWCNWRVEGQETPYTHTISKRQRRLNQG